jgi:hypothetical protein
LEEFKANLSWRKRIYFGKRMPIVENENEYAN